MSELLHLRTSPLAAAVERYLLDLKLRNYSSRTIEANTNQLARFVSWCNEREVNAPCDLAEGVIAGYRRYLYHHINERTGTIETPNRTVFIKHGTAELAGQGVQPPFGAVPPHGTRL